MVRSITIGLMALSVGLTSLLSPATAHADAAAGERTAKIKCAGCHGATGAGNGVMLQTLNVSVPPVPWTSKAGMAKFSDQLLTKVIKEGGQKALGKSPIMPAFGNQLSDTQIADLVAYIHSLAQ